MPATGSPPRASAGRHGARTSAAGFTTAEPLFDAWMASSGHRRQMLGEYTYIGIGVADAADGTAYWTLVVADA